MLCKSRASRSELQLFFVNLSVARCRKHNKPLYHLMIIHNGYSDYAPTVDIYYCSISTIATYFTCFAYDVSVYVLPPFTLLEQNWNFTIVWLTIFCPVLFI